MSAATADIDAKRERDKLRTDAQMEAEKDRIDKQQAAVLKINDAVVAHQVDVIDAALERWTDHAKESASERLNSWAATLGGTGTVGMPPAGMPPRPTAASVSLDKSGAGNGEYGRPTPRGDTATRTLVDPLPDPSRI